MSSRERRTSSWPFQLRFHPPFNIVRLSHVVLTVTILRLRGRLCRYARLQVSDETDPPRLSAAWKSVAITVSFSRGDIAVANELGFKVFDDEHSRQSKVVL